VTGTCDLTKNYLEKSGIESLPADQDWTTYTSGTAAKDVTAGSNIADCCTPTTGKCSGNSDGSAVACGTGYKDKPNKATTTGTDKAACCIQKTCSDHQCTPGLKKKSSPTQPTADNDPDDAGCCEDISGMCSGNKVSTEDVTCTTGYKDKPNKATTTGTDKATCCNKKTCADHTCTSGEKKTSPDTIADGSDPDDSACCGPILKSCMNHLQANVPFSCPSGFYAKDLATVPSVTAVEAKDCPNDAFDVTAVPAIEGFGPKCPVKKALNKNNQGTSQDPAFRSCDKLVWGYMIANGVAMLALW